MPSVFGYIPSGSRYGNVPNELVHRAGPPFLGNHYLSSALLLHSDKEQAPMSDTRMESNSHFITFWYTNIVLFTQSGNHFLIYYVQSTFALK